MDENMLLLLKTYLASLPVGTENDLVKQVQKQDVASMITKLPVLFPSTGRVSWLTSRGQDTPLGVILVYL